MAENLQDLVSVDAQPAAISMNFEQARDALAEHVAQYNIVVTSDTLKDSKAMATELNKTAKALDDRRKAEIAKLNETVRPFDEQMKALVAICKDGRQGILGQVQVFEDETRHQCEAALNQLRADLFNELNVDPDYWSAEFDDLIKLSSMTAAGNLTKSAADTLRSRVAADRAMQDKVENRILRIENESHRAGLAAPLTANHLGHWLRADDATFDAKLAALIDAEIAREAEAEKTRQRKAEQAEAARQANEQAEAERRARAEAHAQRESEPEPQAAEAPRAAPASPAGPQADDQPEATAPPGRVRRRAVATFDVTVPDGTTDEAIKARLRSMLEAAGLTSLSSVEIHHV